MKKAVAVLLGIFLIAASLGVLFYTGVLRFNNPSETEFPVRGVDVSAYQGEIDWEVLSQNAISFAFLKATEGSSFLDERFEENYANAQKTNLRIGVYHFFSYDSSGESQAEHYIAHVAKCENMLPPVIDLEFYGDKEKHPPEQALVQRELQACIDALKRHYGRTPILYATEKSYALYLQNAFPENDIWIRNIWKRPTLPDGRAWTFWQYTNRMRLNGYHGKETYIDMNVFCGTKEAFLAYAKP